MEMPLDGNKYDWLLNLKTLAVPNQLTIPINQITWIRTDPIQFKFPDLFLNAFQVLPSVCRFKSLSYYCHLAASPSFGRADSWGVACRRRQLSALQTMEMPLDGDKYDWLLNLQTLVKSGAIENIFKSQEPFQSYQLTGPA